MTPRLESCYFAHDRDQTFDRLAHVLRITAEQHCAGWSIRVDRLASRQLERPGASPVHVANTEKLDVWHRLVTEAPDGEQILFLDTDTAIFRALDDVWDRPFDMAYTTKTGSMFPFNAGVLFVRVSDPVRAFFQAWVDENRKMLHDQTYHTRWRRLYGGMNQAALGALLKRPRAITLLELPCAEWNCEESAWATFDPARTRILHLKGMLRRAVFGRYLRNVGDVVRPAAAWRALEQAAVATAVRTA